MTPQTLPLTRDVVLIGCGHAHALFLLKWAMSPLAGVRLSLVNPEPTTPYTGMLPGFVAGHYPREALDIDVVCLARYANARLILGSAIGLDCTNQRVQIANRPPLTFDVASVDIGIHATATGIPGFAEHAHAAKPLGPFANAWSAYIDDIKEGRRAPRVVVIGGGIAGVELALAMAHRLRTIGAKSPEVSLIEASTTPLKELGDRARRLALQCLEDHGVILETAQRVVNIDANGVAFADGRSHQADFICGATGATPHAWLAETALDLTDGFVTVDRTLKSVSHPAVYAVGDCAHLAASPRPKAGVFAVRQAPVLYHNIIGDLAGDKHRAFRPQRDFLKLISTGGKSAIAEKFGVAFGGAGVWRLKNRIDRRFMSRFEHFPPMNEPTLPRKLALGVQEELDGGRPLCGGCGAKVGKADLLDALQSVPKPQNARISIGQSDDAAVITIGNHRQLVTTDHFRAMVEDPCLLARIAAIHALGDIWAKGGEPRTVLAHVTLPRMSSRMQRDTLGEIMTAAAETFRQEGADIVGGHSGVGTELMVGFTVIGDVVHRLVTLSGARPGDALILTKPIGTGTILAAEMQKKARGEWVVAAYREMARSQRHAAEILASEASAMTDVTGFGLAGHLLNILDASAVGAKVTLAALPVLAGAEALYEAGVRSSLWLANADQRSRVQGADGTRLNLLFDPQTAGGLLAAVPADSVVALLDRLARVGEAAARIGEITGSAPSIAVD